jgi:hypothetical protein
MHAGTERWLALEIQTELPFIEQPLAMEINGVAQGGRSGT